MKKTESDLSAELLFLSKKILSHCSVTRTSKGETVTIPMNIAVDILDVCDQLDKINENRFNK